MITPAEIEAVARAICREQCAFFGEPPCFENGIWPQPDCNEPGCHALAVAAHRAIKTVKGAGK